MKPLLNAAMFLAILMTGCTRSEKTPSASYRQIEGFLRKSGIADPSYCYFYLNEPRMPLPNVYCFDSTGKQVVAPPQCFAYMRDYIQLLHDSIMPPDKSGQLIRPFLDSTPIIDAFDQPLRASDLKGYDYYLFVDFLAVDQPAFIRSLSEAVESVKQNKRRIRLFLVHAFSEANMKKIKAKKAVATTATD